MHVYEVLTYKNFDVSLNLRSQCTTHIQLTMESIRIPFKQDDFGNDIFARVSWAKDETQTPKPIGITPSTQRPHVRLLIYDSLDLSWRRLNGRQL